MASRSILTRAIVVFLIGVANVQADTPLRIREGISSYGKTILSVDGSKVHQGNSSNGPVLYTLDGNQIREGNSIYGKVLATVHPDGRITEGSGSFGRTFANVADGHIREGASSYGHVIANTDGGRMSGAAAASHILLR